MQQASKREQLELDELLSDIYRGIERLPDEPATTSPSPTQAKANNNNANSNNYNNNTLNKSLSQDNQHYNYNDYQFFNNNNNNISNDSAYDRYFNQQPATNHHHHTVSFATTARRSSKELTERQIKEKAMIEELKRNFKSGALTLRNSFKSPSSTSSSNNKDNNNKTTTNNTNTTNNNNLTAKRYNTTNNRSTSRSPTPNRVTFMRQHSDLTNYRAPQSTKAVNQLKQHTMSSNNRIASSPVRVSEYHLQAEQQLPSTHYTINQQLIVPNGNGSNGTKQQSILTSHSSNTMQPQQKTIYANPHNSLLQHKREQQINNKANLNKCSMKEFDELDSLLNSLKITSSPTKNNYMNNNNNDRNNGQVNRTQNYLSPSSSTPYNKNNIYNSNSTNEPSQTTNALNNYQQQNSDTNVPLYAKVQKNTPIQSNTIQNYNYKSANNYGQQQQQQFNARERNIPVQTTHNNTTTTYYNPNINLSNNGNSNDYGNNEDDNNDGNHVHHTTIENNQHQPIYGHYHEQQNQQHHSENQDPPFDILPSMEYYQLLSKFNTVKNDYWYKPKMSRETAINLLKDKPPGTFIVRDSTSFNGAYGLAVKVSKLPRNIITSTNLRNPNTTSPNELIRHFLIESTTKGVRLKGYANEPVFSSLPALVYQHSITELALPCKLSIPRADVEDPMFAEKQKRFYEEVLAEKIDNTKGIYGNSGVLGGMRNYDGVPIHSEHRIIFDII